MSAVFFNVAVSLEAKHPDSDGYSCMLVCQGW
jgi:hypothetical protein